MGTLMSGSSSAAANSAFISWLEKGGCSLKLISWPQTSEEGRGAVAASFIASETPILFVPRPLLITVERAFALHGCGPILERSSLSAEAVLVAYLLHEHAIGEASEICPFLATLPSYESFADFPDSWDNAELHELQDTTAETLMRAVAAKLRSERRSLREVMKTSASYVSAVVEDDNIFRWAWWIVRSRAFFDSERGVPTLVPMVDQLNHSDQSSHCTIFTEEGFCISASHDVPEGSGLHNSYGRRTNMELLETYGFILDNNRFESVWVDGATPSHARVELFQTSSTCPEQALLSQHRLAVAEARGVDSEQLKRYRASGGLEPISCENEASALQAMVAGLRTALEKLVGGGRGTVRDDAALLARSVSRSGTTKLVTALRFRLLRKRIVEQHLTAAQHALDNLSSLD